MLATPALRRSKSSGVDHRERPWFKKAQVVSWHGWADQYSVELNDPVEVLYAHTALETFCLGFPGGLSSLQCSEPTRLCLSSPSALPWWFLCKTVNLSNHRRSSRFVFFSPRPFPEAIVPIAWCLVSWNMLFHVAHSFYFSKTEFLCVALAVLKLTL